MINLNKIVKSFFTILIVFGLTGCDQTLSQYTNYANQLTVFIDDFNAVNVESSEALSKIQSGYFTMTDQEKYVSTLDEFCDVLSSIGKMNPPTDITEDHKLFVEYSEQVIDGLRKIASLFQEDLNTYDDEQIEEFSVKLEEIDENSKEATDNFTKKGDEITSKVISFLQ